MRGTELLRSAERLMVQSIALSIILMAGFLCCVGILATLRWICNIGRKPEQIVGVHIRLSAVLCILCLRVYFGGIWAIFVNTAVSLIVFLGLTEAIFSKRQTNATKVSNCEPTKIGEAVQSMIFAIDLLGALAILREEGSKQNKDVVLNNILSVRAIQKALCAEVYSVVHHHPLSQHNSHRFELHFLRRGNLADHIADHDVHHGRFLKKPLTAKDIKKFLRGPGNLHWINSVDNGRAYGLAATLQTWVRDFGSVECEELKDSNGTDSPLYSIFANRSKRRLTLCFQASWEGREMLVDLQKNWLSQTRAPFKVQQLTGTKQIGVHEGLRESLGLSSQNGNKCSACNHIINLLADLYEEERFAGFDLYVTGHSWGGALAQFFAYMLTGSSRLDGHQIVFPINCVTFGSPPVGDNNYIESFRKLEEERRIRHIRVKSDVDSYTRPSPHYKQSGLLVYLQRGSPQSPPTAEIQYNAQDEFLQRSAVRASLGSLEEYRLSVKEASKITFKNHSMEDFWRNHTPQGRHHHLAEVVESMLYASEIAYALSAIREAGSKRGLGVDLLSNIDSAHARRVSRPSRISALGLDAHTAGEELDDDSDGIQHEYEDEYKDEPLIESLEMTFTQETFSHSSSPINESRDPRRRRALKEPITVSKLRSFLDDPNNLAWVENIDGICADKNCRNSIKSILDRCLSMGDVEYIEFDDLKKKADPVFGICVNRTMKRITVSFRGTVMNKKDDVLTDLSLQLKRLVLPKEVQQVMGYDFVQIHRGFRRYIGLADNVGTCNRIINLLEDLMEEAKGQYSEYSVYVTGHSLGGALAQVFAFLLAGGTRLDKFFRNFRVTCVSFASPPVGDHRFKECYEMLERKRRLRHLRFSNSGDPVTVTLPYFQQSGLRVHYSRDGDGATYIDYSTNDDFWGQLKRLNIFNPIINHGLVKYMENTRSRSKILFREVSIDEFWEEKVASFRGR